MVREDENETVIKMRGLPWSATVDDIIKFLGDANIKEGRSGVHVTMSKEGRPSGEAFVELETGEDVAKALEKNKQNIGHRYIEIFKTTRSDMEWYVERSGSNVENVVDETCIRLRGLPYGCTKDDIISFFSGLTIVPNGISFVNDPTGRNSGEAYVQFVSKEMVESALKKHLERIGHRYIEIFRSSLAEINAQTGSKIRPLMSELVSRPSPYDRGDRYRGANRIGRSGPAPPPARLRGKATDERFADFPDEDGWESGSAGAPWSGRKPIRDSSVSSSQSLNSGLSPPPAARMRNAMFGNGQGADLWDQDDQKFVVHMRGLPYKATEQDIMNFFRPLIPINIQIVYERNGRPSGEARVEFETYDDAEQAMAKDKQNMNNRYIELFLEAIPPGKPSSLSGRSLSGRSLGGYSEEAGPEPYSRRGRPPPTSVSNSAYDGFYGTSLYRAASSAAAQRF